MKGSVLRMMYRMGIEVRSRMLISLVRGCRISMMRAGRMLIGLVMVCRTLMIRVSSREDRMVGRVFVPAYHERS